LKTAAFLLLAFVGLVVFLHGIKEEHPTATKLIGWPTLVIFTFAFTAIFTDWLNS
jgi:hypothetical protein